MYSWSCSYVYFLQQQSRPTVSADIPSQQAAQPQEPSIQRQYVPMPPGPVSPPKVLLRDNDH